MDAGLWRRLAYPRRLKDGSHAVASGFFGDWFRLNAEQFARFAEGYARPRYVDGLTHAGFAIGLLSLFVLPREAGFGSLLVCIAPGLLLWVVNAYKRAMRFLMEFRPVRPVEVLDHRWSGYRLYVTAIRNRHALAWGTYLLLVGRLTADAFPHSQMQAAAVFGWPTYAVVAGICLAAAAALLAMRTYYQATRGCRLSLENIDWTEGGAGFRLKA